MATIDRTQVQPPAMRREAVPVPSLGADAIVRSRMLVDRLAIDRLQQSIGAALPGEDEQERLERVGAAIVALTLSLQVEASDGKPLFSAEQWALYGADHAGEVLALYRKCQDLSGADREALTKNSFPIRNDDSPSRSRTGWGARLKSLVGA